MASTSAADTPSPKDEARPYDLSEDSAGPPEPDHPSYSTTTPVAATPAPKDQPVAIAQTPASPTPPARDPPLRETTPAAAQPAREDAGVDGLVEQLQAMFTTLDRETIEDVLASNRGNPDASVPQLLELTGQVEARSDAPPAPSTGTTRTPDDDLRRAQEMADAEYARQLMQEEEQASQQYGGLNYEPRRTRPGAQAEQEGGPPQPGHRDELDMAFNQLKEGVEKGRQVATGWFNKASAFAKEKMAQLDQPKQDEQGQNSGSFQLPSSSSSGQEYSRTPATPAVQSTPRSAPALPYGDRYSRPAAPPKGYTATSPVAPPSFASSSREAEPSSSQRITMVDNSRKDKQQDKRADDSDDDELEYTKSPFEED